MELRQKILTNREVHRNNLLTLSLLQGLTLVFFLFAIIAPNIRKEARLGFMLAGLVSSGCQLYQANASKSTASLKEIYDRFVKGDAERDLKIEHKQGQSVDVIRAQEQLLKTIDVLPEHKKAYYARQFKIDGLLQPMQMVQQPSSDYVESVPVRKQLPVVDKRLEEIIDMSWANHDFFFQNNLIAGKQGDGKSSWLAYIALNILAVCPDADLRIYNIHYDPDEGRFFPNMPLDVEESIMVTTAEDALNDMRNVQTELIRREQMRDKKAPPVIRLIDEFQGIADTIGKADTEEFLNICTQVINRGRKYGYKVDGKDTGMRITFCPHSLKKGDSGIGSAVWVSSNVLALGRQVTDPTIPYPSDFDTKRLTQDLDAATAQLREMGLMVKGQKHLDQARPMVMRLVGDSPAVYIVPKFDLSKIQYTIKSPVPEPAEFLGDEETPTEEIQDTSIDTVTGDSNSPELMANSFPGENYLDKLLKWYQAKSSIVTDAELKRQMADLTGVTVDKIEQEMLDKLRSFLENPNG